MATLVPQREGPSASLSPSRPSSRASPRWVPFESENVHEWRKRVKDLWYHLRLLRGSWPEVLSEMGDQAHELSDLLGDHHDLTVLGQDLQNRLDSPGDAESAAIVGVLEARQEELLEAAVPIGERLYADPPKVFVKRLRAYWRAWRPD